MADAFYPFVGEGPTGIDGASEPTKTGGASEAGQPRLGDAVTNPTRIAVFDDPAAAPRVVVVQPSDVRTYLEEITTTVTRLAKEQGGSISFTVIREVVENFVHAYFIEPTISILNNGNTIRFSDQGPGIQEKDRALEYGTTSATEEMKKYIRGVGSGLPYAQQYMEDHGGTLSIEDNMNGGTIVTISMPSPHHEEPGMSQQTGANGSWQQMPEQGTAQSTAQQPLAGGQGWQMQQPQAQQGWPTQQPQAQQGWPTQQPQAQQGWSTQQPPAQQAWPAQQPAPTGQQAYPYPQQGYAPQQTQQPYNPYQQQGWPAQPMMPQYQQPMQPYQQGWQQPYQYPQPGYAQVTPQAAPLELSERDSQVIAYLAEHESVGPTDLVNRYGGSLPTWSRQLQALESRGLIQKNGQKRHLTDAGRSLLG